MEPLKQSGPLSSLGSNGYYVFTLVVLVTITSKTTGCLHPWSKFGASGLNGSWVLARTNFGDGQTGGHTQRQTQAVLGHLWVHSCPKSGPECRPKELLFPSIWDVNSSQFSPAYPNRVQEISSTFRLHHWSFPGRLQWIKWYTYYGR